MVYKKRKWMKCPAFRSPVSFDLEVGDWVAPHGKGKSSDFTFNITTGSDPSHADYSLTFPNLNDGIMEFKFTDDTHPNFNWPYVAPESGYLNEIKKYKTYKTPSHPETNLKRDAINYIFRVRTQTDEKGKITSACYGKIKGDIDLTTTGQLQFEYWFNPVPNQKSLEYNGKNILEMK